MNPTQEEINQRAIKTVGVNQQQAEVTTVLTEFMVMVMDGSLNYYGRPVSADAVRLAVMLKANGYRLEEGTLEKHAAYLTSFGILEPTEAGRAFLRACDEPELTAEVRK